MSAGGAVGRSPGLELCVYVQGGERADGLGRVSGRVGVVPGECPAADPAGRHAASVPVGDGDDGGRCAPGAPYRFNALLCEETVKDTTTTFVWMTNLPVSRDTVVQIAMKGGRRRWTIEAGFNVQKNSELNLEHAYSTDPELIKAYYYLLQIAHMMLQLLERGSLLRRLAQRHGKTPLALFGSLKNIARRLLEDLRHHVLPEEPRPAIQIRFDTS